MRKALMEYIFNMQILINGKFYMINLIMAQSCFRVCSIVATLVCDGPHEVHSQVTPMCPKTCSRLPVCLGLINKESCQCALGYVRVSDTNHTCVREDDCSVTSRVTYQLMLILICWVDRAELRCTARGEERVHTSVPENLRQCQGSGVRGID